LSALDWPVDDALRRDAELVHVREPQTTAPPGATSRSAARACSLAPRRTPPNVPGNVRGEGGLPPLAGAWPVRRPGPGRGRRLRPAPPPRTSDVSPGRLADLGLLFAQFGGLAELLRGHLLDAERDTERE